MYFNILSFLYRMSSYMNTQTCYLPEYSYPKMPKICDPILVTLLKMQPHYSQSSRENATPSSGTSPLACYWEVPSAPTPGVNSRSALASCFGLVFSLACKTQEKKKTITPVLQAMPFTSCRNTAFYFQGKKGYATGKQKRS